MATTMTAWHRGPLLLVAEVFHCFFRAISDTKSPLV